MGNVNQNLRGSRLTSRSSFFVLWRMGSRKVGQARQRGRGAKVEFTNGNAIVKFQQLTEWIMTQEKAAIKVAGGQ